MKSPEGVLQLLKLILESQSLNRIELVKILQNEIWNDESIEDEKLNEILSELAYDLDFYEPNEQWKKESSNYYGEEKLLEVIELGIKRIGEYTKA